MKVENAAGRVVETEIAGRTLKPFAGAKEYTINGGKTWVKP